MNRSIVDENTWVYTAWFQLDKDYYVIEKPIPGYHTTYVNVGIHAGETDRCYNGGTITNSKLPPTGDTTPVLLLTGCLLLSMTGVGIVLRKRKTRKS